jgi:hypothetical protein
MPRVRGRATTQLLTSDWITEIPKEEIWLKKTDERTSAVPSPNGDFS